MKYRFRKSLRYKIIIPVLGLSLPAIILLFIINTYAVERIQRQLYSTNLNMMNVHISELESELTSASSVLLNQSIQTNWINNFASFDSRERYNATIEYHTQNVNELSSYRMIEGQIACSPVNGNVVSYFNDYVSDYQKREAVLEYVKSHAAKLTALNGQWRTCQIDGEWILLAASGNDRAVFCFWTTYDLLMEPVQNWKLTGSGSFCFAGSDGTLFTDPGTEELRELSYDGDLDSYYFDGAGGKYLISGVEVPMGDFRLMNVVERQDALGIFPQLQLLGILILICVLFAGIPWILHILNKNVFSPVGRLEDGIRKVENGDLNTQIGNPEASREMEHLIQSFNKMILQIRDLKIRTYEDSLERQKLELDYLNLQMEPHFYLNALNVINVTAQLGNTEMIYQITKDLSAYMRYIMGSRKESVTIVEELEHVGHYLAIMEIRLGDNFTFRKQVEDGLKELRIPPLTIQTLVENSLKYAFDVYNATTVELDVEEKGMSAVIRVADNGDGYPDEYLERFNTEATPEKNHIGIMNLRSRLKMMYGEKAEIRIFNLTPHGACTEIEITGWKEKGENGI
ncbi:hypothetical protein B5F07_08515 [Lachnoclostridium sp. An169]|uniref:sensor histidine kinase n=1 Tax=Lachnoclostridium sp. An169 TaxID=1965569 RepID=UPI000B3A5C31|nr:histidine kinase [Lachnoclostridium sp. An169]OUP84170.1 hypothetical protein B5F07_08515 [Lachnoclostridium sp. An169]